MRNLINSRFKKYVLPRGLVLVADLFISAAGFLTAYLLRFNFSIDEISLGQVVGQLLFFVLPVYLLAFLWSGSYRGIIRHSSIDDAARFSVAISIATIGLLFIAMVAHLFSIRVMWRIPYSVVLIHTTVTSVMLMGFRLIIRSVYHTYANPHKGFRPTLIFGAGELGQITLNVIEGDGCSLIDVVGFIDDNKALSGKRFSGKQIYSEEQVFNRLLRDKGVREIILAISPDRISLSRKRALLDRCLKSGVSVREVPPVNNWIDGKFNSKQIREMNIGDLLGRDPIWLELDKVSDGLKNAVVLVTGAAGSIGSEIVRQMMKFETRQVILFDQAESVLYDLQNELLRGFSKPNFEVIVGSVTDRYRIRSVFEQFHPQYVFNAAAYKHVPLMEASPYEAIRTNIGGTSLLADLSVEFGVKKFVMISTDKAVNPTNVMGASKRICEIYIQALAQSDHISTQFITTRFGNVLGSNGSVVPLFRRQIEAGGPVTVTHPDIIRYFMTIPEACQLLLEAGFMGNGGEIYVFDMGDPIKIYDLAVKMISLAGLKPDVDIPIRFTGLRPGEKLFEELLADKETTISTHHPKIMAAEGRKHDFGKIKLAVGELLKATQTESEVELVCRMKALVPEFISQNSKFCKCDEIPAKSPRDQKVPGGYNVSK